MSILTKTYRLIWDENKKLFMEPYMTYPSNSATHTNTDNHFESDDIEEIDDKIAELELVYEENVEEYPEEDI
jgi:hypothetical protein